MKKQLKKEIEAFFYSSERWEKVKSIPGKKDIKHKIGVEQNRELLIELYKSKFPTASYPCNNRSDLIRL